ncbi:unnamed protein product [Ambrosiozyma monospora]|uniref:Unnamed protein product n=1 Tax=Ambrosiozyma monospora TaxID=43982 RepID=A0A9W6YRQ2_AMBMO|nr:unnamed protein product [Ambrosiozyma monospora]
MSELSEIKKLAKAIVLAGIAEADDDPDFNSVNHVHQILSSLRGPNITSTSHNEFPNELNDCQQPITERERSTQIEGSKSDAKTITGRFNKLLRQIRKCLEREIELHEKDNDDQESYQAILRRERKFNRYYMCMALSLPILQYLPVPEVEMLTGQPTKQANPTEEENPNESKTRRTRTRTLIGTNSQGAINAIVEFSKPVWFIPVSFPESEPALTGILESKYQEFLKNVNRTAVDEYIEVCPVPLPEDERILTQSSQESTCGFLLGKCLLDELEVCTGYITEKEFGLQGRLAEVLPERMAINGLATNIRVDFAMTKNGRPVLLVEMKQFSIEHLFDEDKCETYTTQSILREVYIYHWVYQMPVMISDSYHHFMIWFDKPGVIAKHPTFVSDPWKLFYDEESKVTSSTEITELENEKYDITSYSAVGSEQSKAAAAATAIDRSTSSSRNTGLEKRKCEITLKFDYAALRAKHPEVATSILKDHDEAKVSNDSGKKINCREIKFRYIRMENTEEGFTVKKKLLALMYDEAQNLTGDLRSVIRHGVGAEDYTEEHLYNHNEQIEQRKIDKAREISKLFLGSVDEWSEMSKTRYYAGVY